MGCVIVLAAVLAGFLIRSTIALQPSTARSEIERQLSELTGLPVFVDGPASFTLLPRTQIALSNIKVGPQTGNVDAVMEIDGIVADLDLWDALWGTARIERLTLVRPELLSAAGFVGQTEMGMAGVSANEAGAPTLRPLSRYIGAFLSRFGSLRTLEIRDGVFRMDPGPGSLGISNANLVVAWPSRNSTARLSGSYVWNGQPTEIGLKIATPVDFLAGAASVVDFNLGSPPLTASFDGEASLADAGSFDGELSVSTPSLTHAIRWLGDPKAILPDIGPLSLEAKLDASEARMNLRDAKVSVDGFTGLGALEMLLQNGKRPAIGGTLAFDRLDLTGLAEAIAPLPQTALDMQRRIPVDFLSGVDLDLRISAADGSIGSLPFEDLAATMKFKDGVGTLDLGDIAILGGQAQARMTVDSTVSPAQAKGVASLNGIDTASLAAATGISSFTLTGASDMHADYSMPLGTWTDLARRSKIDLSMTTRNGALGGFDPRVLAGEAARPLAAAVTGDALAFQTLRARLKSEGPLVDIDTLDIAGSFGRIQASGSLSSTTQRIDLTGSIEPAAPAANTPAGSGSPTPSGLRLQGIWPNPAATSVAPSRPI